LTGFVVISDTLSSGFKKYFAIHKKIHPKAAAAVGLQLINNIVNGSPKETVTPPILTGHLRASGSVFVGSQLVGDTRSQPASGNPGTPNLSHSDNENTITVGFDTPYAAWLHENTWTPGPVSRQSGDVGNKYIEKHLQKDGEELIKLYADIQKKATG